MRIFVHTPAHNDLSCVGSKAPWVLIDTSHGTVLIRLAVKTLAFACTQALRATIVLEQAALLLAVGSARICSVSQW